MFDFFYDELDKAPPPLIPFDLSTIRRFVVIRGGRPPPPTRPHEVDCKIIVYDHLPNDGEEQGKETNHQKSPKSYLLLENCTTRIGDLNPGIGGNVKPLS